MLKKNSGTLSNRFSSGINRRVMLSGSDPERSLLEILPKKSGRNSSGKITMHHIGGRHKRYYRVIDFKRDKFDMPARVVTLEYDPNRNAHIALVNYSDGEKRYILATHEMKVNDVVVSGKNVEVKDGNSLPLSAVPIGVPIHNIELVSGNGGILVRGAGTAARVLAKDTNYATIKLPSGETRLVPVNCWATVGVVSNLDAKNVVLGKAGRSRRLGIRPKVRGVAQNPRTHPHGGGEGRSGEGLKQPKTPWGKPARGLKTRKKYKHSNKYIVERRTRKR